MPEDSDIIDIIEYYRNLSPNGHKFRETFNNLDFAILFSEIIRARKVKLLNQKSKGAMFTAKSNSFSDFKKGEDA